MAGLKTRMALGLAVFLAASADSANAADVTLRVSRSCAATPLVQRSLPAEGNVVALLRQGVRVDAGSGGFVNAIEGIRSGAAEGRQEDWFYFINGVVAPVGAAQYRPAPGDHIWWDFHPWSDAFQVGALIGAFPQPFVGGYGGKASPTRILFTTGFDGEANAIASLLRGRGAASAVPKPLSMDESLDFESHALLLLGPWAALAAHKDVDALHRNADRTGCLVAFDAAGASGRDWSGRRGVPRPSAGAILAVKAGARHGAAAWLVTGTDATETRAAADLLATHPESLVGLAGLMLVDGRLQPVPAP